MIALFAAFLAVASAAPRDFGLSLDLGSSNALSDSFADGFFNTKKFWTDLEKEMNSMDAMLQDFSKQFSSTVTTSACVVGDEYVITATLHGFDEKEIVVKARDGVLMIQAVHVDESGNQKTYMDLRTLPADINTSGTWTYDKDVLKVTFPLVKKEGDESTEVVTEKTEEDRSREEMDKKNRETDEKDADVGLEKDEVNKDEEREISTNEISSNNAVEATTYAVDLKDEVEFVPVRY